MSFENIFSSMTTDYVKIKRKGEEDGDTII